MMSRFIFSKNVSTKCICQNYSLKYHLLVIISITAFCYCEFYFTTKANTLLQKTLNPGTNK